MTKPAKIAIGIRKSKLSIAQTNNFISEFKKNNASYDENFFQVKTIQTTGDVNRSHRLDQIGGKGLFTKEIEENIISGKIDIGIHSLKDLPATEHSDLEIICWLKRYVSSDALISNSGKGISELPSGAVVGTSSIRRRAQILNVRQDLSIKLLRGNVDTRIQKLKDHKYDAIVLSLAGMQRLNLEEEITEVLDHENFLPAACQGAVGIQSKSNSYLKEFFSKLNHIKTQFECSAEREVLKTIKANCNSPVSVFAEIKGEHITISCQLFDHNGEILFKDSMSDEKYNCLQLGKAMGEQIINIVGQKKINELDVLNNDFDYTPKV